MSATLQFVVLLSLVGPALAYLLKKIVVPLAQLIVDTKRMVPYLRYLPILEELQKVLPVLPVLTSIALEFKTDSGSTLKDDIVALRQHARDNAAAAAAALAVGEAAREAALEAARESREGRMRGREDREIVLRALAAYEQHVIEAAGDAPGEADAGPQSSGEDRTS